MTQSMTTTNPGCTVPIEVQFIQSQIRIATEDYNRAKLRLQALEALMPAPEKTVAKKGAWRAPLSKDNKYHRRKSS